MKIFTLLSHAAIFSIASSLFLVPAQAAPIVIDFEGVVASGSEGACPSTPYTEHGFTITASPSGVCNNFISNNIPGNNSFGNTTSVLGVCADCSTPPTMLTLQGATGPLVFTINSIDIGSHFGSNPDPIVFTGYFSGGGTVVETIHAAQTWATYDLIGFTGLSRLEMQWDALGGHADIDNLRLAVPEPASLALLGLGLAGLGFSRRKIA